MTRLLPQPQPALTSIAMIANPLILGSVLFIFTAVLALAMHRASATKPDHHHWIVRSLCALLLIAALTAVGVGTLRGTREEFPSPPVMVKVPAKTPRHVDLTGDFKEIDIGPSKLIGTVLVARMEHDHLLPLCGESLTLEWPLRSSTHLTFKGAHGGTTYTVTMQAQEFVSLGNGGGIRFQGELSRTMRGLGFSSSGSGGDLILDTLKTEDFGNGRDTLSHAPLSIIPSDSSQNLRLIIHLTRADSDDPLEETPASQWLAGMEGKPRQDAMPQNSYPGIRADRDAPPGIRMLVFLGPSAFLLLMAAMSGCACARRGWRAYAFAGGMAAMVLYAGLLDAMVLQHRSMLASDANQPASVRMLAMNAMKQGTFFHSATADARIRAIADDPATPPSLRTFAASLERS